MGVGVAVSMVDTVEVSIQNESLLRILGFRWGTIGRGNRGTGWPVVGWLREYAGNPSVKARLLNSGGTEEANGTTLFSPLTPLKAFATFVVAAHTITLL